MNFSTIRMSKYNLPKINKIDMSFNINPHFEAILHIPLNAYFVVLIVDLYAVVFLASSKIALHEPNPASSKSGTIRSVSFCMIP